MNAEEVVAKVTEVVNSWEAQYTEDDEGGSPTNPFYLIDDLHKVLTEASNPTFEQRDQIARDRADDIKHRLTIEFGNTIASHRGHPELVLTALLDDALFEVEKLLAEVHRV